MQFLLGTRFSEYRTDRTDTRNLWLYFSKPKKNNIMTIEDLKLLVEKHHKSIMGKGMPEMRNYSLFIFLNL